MNISEKKITLKPLKSLNYYRKEICEEQEKEEILIELFIKGLIDFESIYNQIKNKEMLKKILDSDAIISIEDLTKIYKENNSLDIQISCLKRGLIREDLKSLGIDISKNLKDNEFRNYCIYEGYFLNEILENFHDNEKVLALILDEGFGNLKFKNLKLYDFALKYCKTNLIEAIIFNKGYDLEYSLLRTTNNQLLKDFLPLTNSIEVLKEIHKKSSKEIKYFINDLIVEKTLTL